MKKNTDIAIIGMSCRYPGNVESPNEFWQLISNNEDAISDIPSNRWDKDAYYDEDKTKPGKMYVKQGGFVNNLEYFDPQFFNISPKEAPHIDPQHRWLLELSQEAFENAGLKTSEYKGSDTAVYIGQFMHDYEQIQLNDKAKSDLTSHSATGPSMTLSSNRISYTYDFMGPSVTLDTACSSSLVALDLACKAILNGDSKLALAGGVNILLRPELTMSICKASMLSPDARCKSFDASANGYVRSEGAGLVLVKKLEEAQKDGDNILAVIKATGSNQDGQTIGITVPNGESQKTLLKKTIAQAGFNFSDIQYAEAHGTGTAVGDPIEINALGTLLGARNGEDQKCTIGSVKSNIGHTESAAGVAGLIKSVMAINHKQFPANIHLNEVNPAIDEDALNIKLAHKSAPWVVSDNETRKAIVNSFGFGGTNSNVVLEEALSHKGQSNKFKSTANNELNSLIITSKSKQGLKDQVTLYKDFLENSEHDINDICFNAATCRDHYAYRAAFTGKNKEEINNSLDLFLQDKQHSSIIEAKANSHASDEICFVFSGMGTTWADLGHQLYLQEPTFKHSINKVSLALEELSGFSLEQVMFNNADKNEIHSTQYAQPAIFAIQVSLVELLKSWGITPSAIVGHSAGEVAAAYAAGVLNFADAIKVVFHRSQLQHSTEGSGKMLAVGVLEDELKSLLANRNDKVSVAAINSEDAITLSGDEQTLIQIAKELDDQGKFARFLKVDVPYHSPQMDCLKQPLIDALSGINVSPAKVPLYSTVTGELSCVSEDPQAWGELYWPQNVREPVLFKQAIENLLDDGFYTFLEVAPHAALSSSIKKNAEDEDCIISATLIRNQDDQLMLRNSLVNLFVNGVNLDTKLLCAKQGKFVQLPNTAWQRDFYWNESEVNKLSRLKNISTSGGFGTSMHELLGGQLQSTTPIWQSNIDLNDAAWIRDHQVENEVVYPGAGYVEMALKASTLANYTPFLEDIKFHKALFVDADKGCKLETKIENNQFIINTFDNTTKQWVNVSQGNLLSSHKTPKQQQYQINQLKTLGSHYDTDSFYQHCGALGLNYQGLFQGVSQAWFNQESCLVEINIDESINTNGYILHPTILDAAFQSIFPTLTSGFLPVAIGQLNIFGDINKQCYALLTTTFKSDSNFLGDLIILNQNGETVAEILAVALKATNTNNQNESLLWGNQWINVDVEKDNIEKSWLLINCNNNVSDAITCKDKISLLIESEDFTKEALNWMTNNPQGNIVFSSAFDQEISENFSSDELFDATQVNALNILKFSQLVDQAEFSSKVIVLTQHAMSEQKTQPTQSALWGFTRVWANEQPNLDIMLIDLQSNQYDLLNNTLYNSNFEQELIITDQVLANRFSAIDANDLKANADKKTNTYQAFSLNLLTGNIHKNNQLKDEQTHWIGLSSICDKTAITGNSRAIALCDNKASSTFNADEQSFFIENSINTLANILDYGAASFVLDNLTDITGGQSLLITQADDLFGQALIDLALSKNIKVTAIGTSQKVTHSNVNFINQNSISLFESFIDQPKFDLIINRFDSYDYVQKSLKLLTPFGEFVDLTANDSIHLSNSQKLINFNLVDVIKFKKAEFYRAAENVKEFINNNGAFKSTDLKQWQQHSCNVINTLQAKPIVKQGKLDKSISPTGSYIVTGGLGGLGLELMDWLANHGAGCIILLGRSKPSIEAQQRIDKVIADGNKVVTLQADVCNGQDVAEVFSYAASNLPKVKGLIHAAGVLRDGAINGQTPENFNQVLIPKVKGTWNLHKQSENLNLDFFVCFSSIASFIGWQGQSNYASANAFMDGFVKYRNNLGLAASSINWGPWAQAGMAANLDDRELKTMQDAGMNPISIKAGLNALDELIINNQINAGVFDINWSKIIKQYVNPNKKTQLKNLVDAQQENGAINFLEELNKSEQKKKLNLLIEKSSEIMAQVLGLDNSDNIDKHQSVFDYGLNSLMGMDFKNRLQSTLDIKLPATLVMKYPTVSSMCQFILDDLLINQVTPTTKKDPIWHPDQPELYNSEMLTGEIQFTTGVANMIRQGQSSHFNLSGMIEISEQEFDYNALNKAVNILLRHHDGARVEVYKHNNTWTQEIAELAYDYVIPSFDLSDVDYPFARKKLEEMNDQLQKDFSFEKGNPLYRMAHYKINDINPHRFILIFHHFIADGMSLMNFQQDLDAVYKKVKTNEPVYFDNQDISLKDWTNKLNDFANTSALSQIGYWKEKAASGETSQNSLNKGNEKSAINLTSQEVIIDKETTKLLEAKANTLNVDLVDLGTLAIANGLKGITGSQNLWADLVIHGRSGIFDDIEIPNLFGQIAEYSSIYYEVDSQKNSDQNTQSISQQRKSLPNNGIAMKAIEYLGEPDIFTENQIPKVLINFDLNDYDLMASKFAKESLGETATLVVENQHSYEFHFKAIRKNGGISLNISYWDNCQSHQAVETLCSDIKNNLLALENLTKIKA